MSRKPQTNGPPLTSCECQCWLARLDKLDSICRAVQRHADVAQQVTVALWLAFKVHFGSVELRNVADLEYSTLLVSWLKILSGYGLSLVSLQLHVFSEQGARYPE